jgi:hypothetical protein
MPGVTETVQWVVMGYAALNHVLRTGRMFLSVIMLNLGSTSWGNSDTSVRTVCIPAL